MSKNQKLSRSVLPLSQPESSSAMPLDVRTAPKPEPIHPLRPPQGAPHIVIVLIDDMGFGASSAFGGPCFMPTVERLATRGLTYTRFHTTALCSPTRAALLTGRNHHSVNMGSICETASSYRGYTSIRPDSAVTIAQTLRMNGYNTAAFGKMHQTPTWETSQAGPFDRWPTGDGFEKFYGFLGGDCNQWASPLIDGTTAIDPPRTPEEGYHLSEDITEKAISYVRQQQVLAPDKPFFVYLAFGATHALHHLDEIGGPLAFNHYPAGWAHAMNTPYQWTKIIASHWGGTRNGMVVHWPQHIKTKGLRHQWCHCIDVVPTILEAVHLPHPTSINGVVQQPIEGTSFLATFQQTNAPEKHLTQYFELAGNRAIYQDGWSACTKHSMPWTVPEEHLPAFTDDVWELYAPDDWSQAHNVASTYPGKLHELQQLFLAEAAKYHVLPLDDRKYERLNAE